MSFLINAIGKQIINAIEAEIVDSEPFIAQALLSEAHMLFNSLAAYAENKLNNLANPAPASQPVTPLPEVNAV